MNPPAISPLTRECNTHRHTEMLSPLFRVRDAGFKEGMTAVALPLDSTGVFELVLIRVWLHKKSNQLMDVLHSVVGAFRFSSTF